MAIALVVLLGAAVLQGCRDSEAETNVVQVEYDPAEAIAPYLGNLPELTEVDKSRVIQMGFNDCDHMVAAIIGQEAGIYEALGLLVEITKTNQVATAVAAGQFDTAYAGWTGSINSYENEADVITLVGSHLGGALYLVLREGIESLDQIESLTVSEASMRNPTWLRYASELGMDPEYTAYSGASMSQPDSLVALKAAQIDGIMVCDPYASIAEYEGFGKIVNVAWGSLSEELGIGWGECCNPVYYKPFVEEHPALTARLVLAHYLATQYLYTHPYNAAMMFADTFGTSPDVGLRTIFLKTNAEGRTMNWEIGPQNLQNMLDFREYWGIPEEDWPRITRTAVEDFFDLSFMEMLGLKSFAEFEISSGIAETFPVGMAYSDWLHLAETIDGIDHDSTIGKTVGKWMDGGFVDVLPFSANPG